MKKTGSQLLPYPEDFDIANGASYLQALAEAVEAKLVGEAAQFSDFEEPDILILSKSVAQTGIGSTTTNFLSTVTWDTVVYDNKGAMAGVIPTWQGLRMLRSGVYGVGFYLPTTVVGTVTATSRRNARVSWNFIQGPSTVTIYNYFVSIDAFESSTGGENQTLYTTAEVPASTGGPVDMKVQFFHTNSAVGSSVTIQAGAFAYYHRIRPIEAE